MEMTTRKSAPAWLALLGAVGLVALAGSLGYALVIAAHNIVRIGV